MNPAFQVVPPSLDSLPRATDRNFKQLTDLMQSWDRSFGPVGDLSVTGNASVGGTLSVASSSTFTGPASFAGAATFAGATFNGAATFNAPITASGSPNRFAADNNYFGAGALGAAGTYANVGSLGDPNNVYIDANGTPTNVSIFLRGKGSLGHIFMSGGGNSIAYADAQIRAFYANGLTGATHESRRRDAQAVMCGFGFAYSADNTAHPGGGTAGLAISVNRANPAAIFTNSGSGSILEGYQGGTLKFQLGSSGQLQAAGADIYLGAYAFGAAGTRWHLYSGDPNVMYVTLESSVVNSNVFFSLKGTGIYRFYDGSSQYMADIRGVTEVGILDTALWLYWKEGSGTAHFTKVTISPTTNGGLLLPGSHMLVVIP